ncbi:hypothetical protein SEA_EASTWEST_49 [Arthrobacter phage EastWest]|uniref:Uncharacterized protein n=1 Tax=Arthrobacter phage EastWest TaxID=2894292 RepID=A0AAE8YP39_9CAUD|nr:hypothetical protein SEA_EASTWEST_49 [Arthrobacter phage EastWest]
MSTIPEAQLTEPLAWLCVECPKGHVNDLPHYVEGYHYTLTPALFTVEPCNHTLTRDEARQLLAIIAQKRRG